MRKLHLLLAIAVVVIVTPSFCAAQTTHSEVTPLSNKDVLHMVANKLDTEAIVKAINSSPCTFDTFPPVLKEMKRRGVPEAVLQAMMEAPYGPSLARSSRDDLGEQPIYHYADQLKQMGFITPTTSGRLQITKSRARASRSRRPE
ncbi:MAG: hypothetical protein M3539_01580 [Acidobacteriota bacterium]|nr:hypothetical protein [Acidobacteriota bacterium]